MKEMAKSLDAFLNVGEMVRVCSDSSTFLHIFSMSTRKSTSVDK